MKLKPSLCVIFVCLLGTSVAIRAMAAPVAPMLALLASGEGKTPRKPVPVTWKRLSVSDVSPFEGGTVSITMTGTLTKKENGCFLLEGEITVSDGTNQTSKNVSLTVCGEEKPHIENFPEENYDIVLDPIGSWDQVFDQNKPGQSIVMSIEP